MCPRLLLFQDKLLNSHGHPATFRVHSHKAARPRLLDFEHMKPLIRFRFPHSLSKVHNFTPQRRIAPWPISAVGATFLFQQKVYERILLTLTAFGVARDDSDTSYGSRFEFLYQF